MAIGLVNALIKGGMIAINVIDLFSDGLGFYQDAKTISEMAMDQMSNPGSAIVSTVDSMPQSTAEFLQQYNLTGVDEGDLADFQEMLHEEQLENAKLAALDNRPKAAEYPPKPPTNNNVNIPTAQNDLSSKKVIRPPADPNIGGGNSSSYTMNSEKTIEHIRNQFTGEQQQYFDDAINSGSDPRVKLIGKGKELYMTSSSDRYASGN